MPSDRALKANRLNAQASTGPRTEAGRARASQNARKHGLATQIRDHETAEGLAAEQVVKAIVTQVGSDPDILEAARDVADADIHVRRVLAFKHQRIFDDQTFARARGEMCENVDDVAWSMLFDDLDRLERYERRAFSRRKTAIRRLIKLLLDLPERSANLT